MPFCFLADVGSVHGSRLPCFMVSKGAFRFYTDNIISMEFISQVTDKWLAHFTPSRYLPIAPFAPFFTLQEFLVNIERLFLTRNCGDIAIVQSLAISGV